MSNRVAPFIFENPVLQKDGRGNYVFAPYWQLELEKVRRALQIVIDTIIPADAMAPTPPAGDQSESLIAALSGGTTQSPDALSNALPPITASVIAEALQGLLAIVGAPPVPANFYFIAKTIADQSIYPPAQFYPAIYFATDTNLWYYSTGAAWTQFGNFDTAYDATTWNASTKGTTQNAVRDKFEQLAPGSTDALVSDTAFGVGWDGDTLHAPSKNAVYDKVVAMDATIATKLTGTGFNFSGPVANITVVNGAVTAAS